MEAGSYQKMLLRMKTVQIIWVRPTRALRVTSSTEMLGTSQSLERDRAGISIPTQESQAEREIPGMGREGGLLNAGSLDSTTWTLIEQAHY